ncbi:phage tail tape measure protein [Ruminococcus sp.]|uniref:phage tail tape measure protein n=1 Tax=Ruminococcus sp. TaxID=41978 RepID=UPI003528981C
MKTAGENAGKSYTTAMQRQIEAMAKSQQTAFTQPLRNITKYQQDYSDWWNKALKKSSDKNYGKNQQFIAFDEYKAEMDELEKRVKKILNYVSKDSLGVDTTSIRKSLDKYSNVDSDMLNKAEDSYKKLVSLKKELETGISDDGFGKTLSDKDFISKFEQYNSLLEKTRNQVKILGNEFSGLTKPLTAMDNISASNKTLAWLNNNSRAAKKYKEILEDLAAKQRSASTLDELRQYNKEVNSVISEAKAQGLTGKSWFSDAKRAFGQIFQFAGMYGMIQNVAFEVPKQMLTAVKNVNTAQIELTKVSDATETQLSNYWDQASVSAKKYGATISDVISSTADWSRLGYNLNEAKELSDATTLIQKVGDNMTQQSSSEGMISVLKGFKMQANQAESIVDKVNKVANTQPIDTSGLFAGLERSASSLNAANNSLEQSIALITAANSVVQDPDSVGTAFKTISMRIRGASTDLEQAGLDTEGMATSTSKLRAEIKALSGVDIMKNANEFKSTYDILDELSYKWSELTDIQQASVTELIAGKRQGNIVSSLMSNFDIARKTLNTALNDSDGSAEKELSNYQKGIEYSIEKFKASFQEMSSSIIDSDLVKFTVDTGSTVVSSITKIIDKVGLLKTAFASIAGIKIFKNLD